MKLTGKNFQPWGEFSLDIDGLTLIVGPSNRGKSSIFRALRGVLRNDLPAEFVRDGQTGPLEVELEVEGRKITATRTRKGSSKYVIDDDKFSALGGNIPQKVKDLKFNEVQVGEAIMDPIFSEQNRAQFLIDPERYKPTELNAILGAFASTEKLDAGKKEANLRITQRNSDARTLAEEIREAEERKELLAQLSGKLSVVFSDVNNIEARVSHFKAKAESVQEAIQGGKKLAVLREIIGRVSLPDISKAASLERKSVCLFQAAVRLVRHRLLTDIGFSIDSAVARWGSVAKAYKQQKGISAVLETIEKRKASPKEYAERLGMVLKEVESGLASTSGLLITEKSVAAIQVLTASVARRGVELEEVEKEHKEAIGRLLMFSAAEASEKAKKPKCPQCGAALVCPLHG